MKPLEHIRPSALPKLESQPCFVGAPGEASEAAKRGTIIDECWRELLQGRKAEGFDDLPPEDKESVLWAVGEANRLCGGAHIITDEEKTRWHHPFFKNPFTSDGVCLEKGIIIDLKTGQLRSYRAQLGAYCLALMTETWTQKATGIALFCDQRESIVYEFKFDEVHDYIEQIIEAVVARQPDDYTPGDYCGWCAKADTCPARTRDAETALELVTGGASLEQMRQHLLADPARLGEFWRQWKLFEKEIVKPIGDTIKARLDGGETIPGWNLRYDAGREFFDSEAIEEIAATITTAELITLLGAKVSGKQFREFCAVKGLTVPEPLARTGAPIAKLMPEKTKKTISKKGK